MTVQRIKVWHCDAASCEESAPEKTPGWFDGVTVQGCPGHAEIVEAHKPVWRYDTRGRGRKATTTVSLVCACGVVPPSRWSQGSTELLEREHLAHVREATTPVPVQSDTTEEEKTSDG